MPLVLLVDDDEVFAGLLEEMLAHGGHQTIHARNGREALRLYDPNTVSFVLTDLVMPDMDGIELIIELRRRHPGVKIIAMSGGGSRQPSTYLRPARLLGANCTLAKPFTNEHLFAAIQIVLGCEVT